MKTPMLTKLEEVLASMTREEFLAQWREIEQLEQEGITAKELILSFEMPLVQDVTSNKFTSQITETENFNINIGNNSFAMAA